VPSPLPLNASIERHSSSISKISKCIYLEARLSIDYLLKNNINNDLLALDQLSKCKFTSSTSQLLQAPRPAKPEFARAKAQNSSLTPVQLVEAAQRWRVPSSTKSYNKFRMVSELLSERQ